MKYNNYLFWWIVRGDGKSHSGQNGAGKFVIKIRVSVSNGHCSRGESGDPIEPWWLLWKAKMVPNTQQGEILTVQLLEMGSLSLGDILHPGNVTLFPSSPTPPLPCAQTSLEQSVAWSRNKVQYSHVHSDNTKQKRGSKIIKTLTRLKIKQHGWLGSSVLAYWVLMGYLNYLQFLLQRH